MTKRITLVYALALCLIFGIAYLVTRSISYDDFDSYNFGLAVTRFDLSLQQPQPPGFPLYILTAQGLNSLIQNPLSSLTTLSALTGMLAVVIIFFIGVTVFQSPTTAFLIALIFDAYSMADQREGAIRFGRSDDRVAGDLADMDGNFIGYQK